MSFKCLCASIQSPYTVSTGNTHITINIITGAKRKDINEYFKYLLNTLSIVGCVYHHLLIMVSTPTIIKICAAAIVTPDTG